MDHPTWFTFKYLEDILRKFFKDDSVQVQDLTIDTASTLGENYACYLFRIKVDYLKLGKKKSRSIIAKLIPNSESAIELNEAYNMSKMFKTEMKMFSKTLPLLHEELVAKGETVCFFPYMYKLSMENEPAVLFMEDLAAEGYVLADRKASFDLDHTLAAIKTMAKMHAASYLLFQKYPNHENLYLDYEYSTSNHGVMEKVTNATMYYTIKSLHLWPISEEDKIIFRSFLGKSYELACKNYERKKSGFNVLIHGDPWMNNIMYKYNKGNIVSVKFIDYQFSNYNSIGLDLNYFLFTSAKEYVKMNHLEDVFQTYYDAFVGVTGEIERFTVDTVREEFIERLGFGFFVGIFYRFGMVAEKAFDGHAMIQCSESEINTEIFQNKECIMEAAKLLPIFKKHGIFKLY